VDLALTNNFRRSNFMEYLLRGCAFIASKADEDRETADVCLRQRRNSLSFDHLVGPRKQRRGTSRNRGMVRWPTSRRRFHPLKAHISQIERIDKHIDQANGVTLTRVVRALIDIREIRNVSTDSQNKELIPCL
jgi:hypothetical protein